LFVICYFLKLQLLGKYFKFDKDKGLQTLRKAVRNEVESHHPSEDKI